MTHKYKEKKMSNNKQYTRTMVKYVGNIQRLFDVYDQSIEDQLVSMLEDFISETIAARAKDSLADKKARGERVGATPEVLLKAREYAEASRRRKAKESNHAKLKVIETAVSHIRQNRNKVGHASVARLLNGPVFQTIQNEENSPEGSWYSGTVHQTIRHALENDYALDILESLICLESWRDFDQIKFLQ